MEEKLTITISKKGETTVSVKGVKGKGCKALTEGIERAIGNVTADVATEEMKHVNVQVANRNRH